MKGCSCKACAAGVPWARDRSQVPIHPPSWDLGNGVPHTSRHSVVIEHNLCRLSIPRSLIWSHDRTAGSQRCLMGYTDSIFVESRQYKGLEG